MTNQTSTNLDNPLLNVLAIVISSVILNMFYIKGGGVPEDAGMAAFFLNLLDYLPSLFT